MRSATNFCIDIQRIGIYLYSSKLRIDVLHRMFDSVTVIVRVDSCHYQLHVSECLTGRRPVNLLGEKPLTKNCVHYRMFVDNLFGFKKKCLLPVIN